MIACGMVGSAHGWREAAYVQCPIDLNQLHRHLTLVRGADGLEPGSFPARRIDPRRSRPTSCAARKRRSSACSRKTRPGSPALRSCCPGRTRSGSASSTASWCRSRPDDGRAVRRPALAFGIEPVARGFDRSRPGPIRARPGRVAQARGGDLSHLLFGVRTLHLFGERSPVALTDYLSGLLIGRARAGSRRRLRRCRWSWSATNACACAIRSGWKASVARRARSWSTRRLRGWPSSRARGGWLSAVETERTKRRSHQSAEKITASILLPSGSRRKATPAPPRRPSTTVCRGASVAARS